MSGLRIIAGNFKGRQINSPDNNGLTHPMGERERAAIMNSLVLSLPGASVLDFFAGSGALGLEAISRGAKNATFIEKDRVALQSLRQNIAKLSLDARCQLIKKPEQLQDSFDIIFADPPYDNPQFDLLPSVLTHLVAGGFFILSHDKAITPPDFEGLQIVFDKTYARANIKIYQKP